MIGIAPISTYPISTRTITAVVAATNIVKKIDQNIDLLDVYQNNEALNVDTKLKGLFAVSRFEDI